MGVEDAMLRRIDNNRSQGRRENAREATRGPRLDEAHKQIQELFRSPDYAIQAIDFIDLYGRENVAADLMKTKQQLLLHEREQTPEQAETKKLSDIFEGIVLQQSELGDWLGSNAAVLKTSLYDDYFNGTDMIAEWLDPQRESNVLALGVDVTFGRKSVERKLLHIRRDVEGGKLGKIKYFRSSDGSFRGERTGVPHVVIGVARDTVQELAGLWMKKDKKALGVHPAQRILVNEIYQQLKTVQAHASSVGQTKVAEAYQRSLAIVEKIRQEKASVPLGRLENDRVYGEIMDQTKTVFR